MKKLQQGFTLIELMIVVAIVGILAAIAIPAYQDFIIRSKVTEAAATMSACKTSVAEYYAATNSTLPGSVAQAGCSNVASQYVSSVAVATGGIIQVTITGTHSGSDPDGLVLQLSPNVASNAITGWSCSTTASKKYVPATCRG